MKLNSAQVQRTLGQFEARVIPDEDPVIAQLNELFGEHTFFLDQHGLNIVEPVEVTEPSAECARVVQTCQLEQRQPIRSQAAARARRDGHCRDAGIEALRPSEQIRRATRPDRVISTADTGIPGRVPGLSFTPGASSWRRPSSRPRASARSRA